MTKVLVIDDSPTEMARFRDVLTKNNYMILEATNGERGIQMAIEHQPDVILMDVVMPEMNGFQATRKITRNKATAHIPVVIVSTKNQETDRVWGKRQGAKEYLTKPINEAELLKVIQNVKSVVGAVDSQQGIQSAQVRQSPSLQQPKQSVQGNAQQQPLNYMKQNQSERASPNKPNDEADDNGIYL